MGLGPKLEGRVAIVTGGANGIGRAIVDSFVENGCKVGVIDINDDALAAVKSDHGDSVIQIKSDVRRFDENLEAVQKTVEAFGRLDTYVANAGMFDGFTEFSDFEPEQLDRGFSAIFDVNVRGVLLGLKAALPHLKKTSGNIILTLSNSALYPDGGGVLYVASKHAALGITRQLAHELAPHIRVNAVAPGATKTSIGVPKSIAEDSMDQMSDEVSAMITEIIPLRIHADPEAHSGAYVLLASDDSRAMTGTVIESDGGLGVRGIRRIRGGD